MSRRSGSIHASGRIGRPFRVEYVNRVGEKVNPFTRKLYGRMPAIGRETNGVSRNIVKSKSGGIIGGGGSSSSSSRKPLPIKRSGALFSGLNSIPTNPNIDPPPHACFNCWLPGHKRSVCTKPATFRFCNNCGRKNEDMRSCPRCRDAHEKWFQLMCAKERGEKVEDDLLMISDVHDDEDEAEIEELNDPDEILQELIYQDQKTRELLEYQKRKREQRDTLNAIYKSNELLSKQGAFVEYESRVPRESVLPALSSSSLSWYDGRKRGAGKELRRTPVSKRPLFTKELKRKTQQLRDNDSFNDGTIYDNENNTFHGGHKLSQQERNIGMAIFKERESYVQDDDSEYLVGDERLATLESRRIEDSDWRQVMVNASSVTNNTDPVQDILILAKTISHLSPETQDLVMRQVIAERQQKARQRTLPIQELSDSQPPW